LHHKINPNSLEECDEEIPKTINILSVSPERQTKQSEKLQETLKASKNHNWDTLPGTSPVSPMKASVFQQHQYIKMQYHSTQAESASRSLWNNQTMSILTLQTTSRN